MKKTLAQLDQECSIGCTGFHACKDRTYDRRNPDCKECEADMWQALNDLERPEEVF